MTTLQNITKWLSLASPSILMLVAANVGIWVVMIAATLNEPMAIVAHLVGAWLLLAIAVVAWRRC